MTKEGYGMILTEIEAKVYETLKQGHQWDECEVLLDMKTRTLTTICQRLVTFNLLTKIKAKHYIALPGVYEVKSDKEVKKTRKGIIDSMVATIETKIPNEAALYIIGHYSIMKRSKLLSKLHEAGYNIGKFALNQFIVDNKLDKTSYREDSMRAVG